MSEFDFDDFSPSMYAAENADDDSERVCRKCGGPVEIDSWYEDGIKHYSFICRDIFCAEIETTTDRPVDRFKEE